MFLFSSPIPNILKYAESCIRLKPGERKEALNIHSLKGIKQNIMWGTEYAGQVSVYPPYLFLCLSPCCTPACKCEQGSEPE